MKSLKNTRPEANPVRIEPLPELPSDKRDDQIATLQEQLASEKDARLEERYWLLFLSAVFFDCFILSTVGALGIVIVLLQLVPMIFFAKKLGIDEVAVMLDVIGSAIASRLKKD